MLYWQVGEAEAGTSSGKRGSIAHAVAGGLVQALLGLSKNVRQSPTLMGRISFHHTFLTWFYLGLQM